ncbi:MAG: dTDP-4-dehydrorhamnose reductase [Myxococcota bacterium]
MRVLLTGSTGQLGSAMQALGAADLTLLPHDRSALDLAGDGAAIEAAVRASRPEVILNAGAYTAVDQAEEEPELAHRVNGSAVGALARAANATGALLLQVSTDYVFDGRLGRAYREDDAPNPLGVYAASKLAGEQEAAKAARHLVVRTSWVYSHVGKNFVRTMWRLTGEQPRLRVVGDQFARPTSADQLAGALLDLLRRHRDGEALPAMLHVTGGGDETSWRDLAALIAEERAALRGGDVVPVDPIGTAEYGAPAPRPARSTLDVTKAETLGVAPGDWRDEVTRIVGILAAKDSEEANR